MYDIPVELKTAFNVVCHLVADAHEAQYTSLKILVDTVAYKDRVIASCKDERIDTLPLYLKLTMNALYNVQISKPAQLVSRFTDSVRELNDTRNGLATPVTMSMHHAQLRINVDMTDFRHRVAQAEPGATVLLVCVTRSIKSVCQLFLSLYATGTAEWPAPLPLPRDMFADTDADEASAQSVSRCLEFDGMTTSPMQACLDGTMRNGTDLQQNKRERTRRAHTQQTTHESRRSDDNSHSSNNSAIARSPTRGLLQPHPRLQVEMSHHAEVRLYVDMHDPGTEEFVVHCPVEKDISVHLRIRAPALSCTTPLDRSHPHSPAMDAVTIGPPSGLCANVQLGWATACATALHKKESTLMLCFDPQTVLYRARTESAARAFIRRSGMEEDGVWMTNTVAATGTPHDGMSARHSLEDVDQRGATAEPSSPRCTHAVHVLAMCHNRAQNDWRIDFVAQKVCEEEGFTDEEVDQAVRHELARHMSALASLDVYTVSQAVECRVLSMHNRTCKSPEELTMCTWTHLRESLLDALLTGAPPRKATSPVLPPLPSTASHFRLSKSRDKDRVSA